MKNFEHFSVNWVKGMNINASHFIDTENFFLERLAKITSISFNNLYGALPNSLLSPSDIEIQPIGDKCTYHFKKILWHLPYFSMRIIPPKYLVLPSIFQ